eukprot:2897740-Pleurochrysis_carterae.AAC.1
MLGVASPDILISRSRYLLQCLASNIAASGCNDYGRAPGECVTTTRPATPSAHSHTVRTEAKSPLDHGAAMG